MRPELKIKLDKRSKLLRKYVVDCLIGGGRGHVGSALSLVEILRVLYDKILNFDPKNPKKKNRDRLILSKGHACLAYYAALSQIGILKKEDLLTFEKDDSSLLGHPVKNEKIGIDFSTGSLGMGLSLGIGVAIALKKKKNK